MVFTRSRSRVYLLLALAAMPWYLTKKNKGVMIGLLIDFNRLILI